VASFSRFIYRHLKTTATYCRIWSHAYPDTRRSFHIEATYGGYPQNAGSLRGGLHTPIPANYCRTILSCGSK
jgi:hypothetical protein